MQKLSFFLTKNGPIFAHILHFFLIVNFSGSARHGGLNQEKYLKSCLGLGPICFESTTPEVFKTTFREIADFRPSAQCSGRKG